MRKAHKKASKYNYELMKKLNDDMQMTDVWRLPAIGRWEKSCGKHPMQKPLSVLTRIIHKAKPIFDREQLSFHFQNGLVEKVKVERHLTGNK